MIETSWSVSCEMPMPRTRRERRVYKRVLRVTKAWAKHVGKPFRYSVKFDRIIMPRFTKWPERSVVDDPEVQRQVVEWVMGKYDVKPLER